MHNFKKYSLQKITRRITRKGSTLQKRALKFCNNVGLFSKPSFIQEISVVGPMVLDLCSWGHKEIELVYLVTEENKLRTINFLDLKYSFLSNYKHTVYTNHDTVITFFYEDWKIVLHVTSHDTNFKKILFAREYLIDNLSPDDRTSVVSMCRASVPLGYAIKNAVIARYGIDHVLTRLSEVQVQDTRYDMLLPLYQFIMTSGVVLESVWDRSKNDWMLKKEDS